MALTDEIIATVETWQEQLRAQLDAANPSTLSMATLEQAALALGQRLAQLAMTDQLGQVGTGYTASYRPCDCGSKQRFQRYSERSVRADGRSHLPTRLLSLLPVWP